MRKLAAGNWKMNGLKAEGLALARDITARANQKALSCDLLLCPPATLLAPVAEAIAGSAVVLGGQNCHAASSGAHTGEVSAPMLKDVGCSYVILGHSERRTDQGETDAQVQAKVVAAHKAGLVAIVCIGETLAQRDGGETLAVISRQLAGSLPEGLDSASLVIAYEPVWAIGTGRTPTVEQVAAVHSHIRRELAGKAKDPAGVRILYGGSVKPSNARELMNVKDVDGALVGGASLVAADFWAIVEACS
ncbi:MAG TPA: triose-phosphate isomerase [Stellaceae bacterium]|jgi:triosephosphate isomerase|nr:triose-phosphate isomerase [Stellaceae bacterium]